MPPSVLLVNNYRHVRGGSDRCFLEQTRLLESRGHRVVTLASGPATRPGDLELEPLDLRHPGPLGLARFLFSRRARDLVRALQTSARRVDLAHLHITYGQVTASILAPLVDSGVPIVQTLHEYRLVCPVSTFISRGTICEACTGGRTWPAVRRRCNRGSLARSLVSAFEHRFSRALGSHERVDHFIAPSEFLRAKMIEHGLAPERISTVPNFVDARALEPARGPGEYFLYCGRLERLKGVLTLVRASARVPEVPLLLVGDGEARRELEGLLADPRHAHVRLVGRPPRAELERLVRGARCVICPSEWYENHPLVVLEAMAVGRAVIATRIGGLPELVQDGQNGLSCAPGDEEALAGLLRHAADHPGELVAMGARGRERTLDELGPDAHHRQLMALYELLLAARGGAS
jgi:glycosyltransferase involved in cell wall biosynthesis